jgi:hypothetical protein
MMPEPAHGMIDDVLRDPQGARQGMNDKTSSLRVGTST